jgi:predicted N-acetyltransferase YhbS
MTVTENKGERLRIAILAEHPDHIQTVSSWVFNEWGSLTPGVTLEKVVTKFQTHLNLGRIPLTFIALQGQAPVGTASLVLHDISDRTELSPWLAAVYVLPEQRGNGIGTRLVLAAERAAVRLGVSRLYLFTHDRERFYMRLGWQAFDRIRYRGQGVVIMEKGLMP